MALLLAAGCHTAGSRPGSVSAGVPAKDYCGMALSALHATIASNDAEPNGLEDACVRHRAFASGYIFVDARVSEREGEAPLPAPSCVADGFRIRFDPAEFEKAPTDGVVLLLIWRSKEGAMEFNALVERPDWPSNKPGVFGLSPCGSAFGTIRRLPTGWTATVVEPPRVPGEL